jgi:membrane-associated PAP2 superfamily phosphatase
MSDVDPEAPKPPVVVPVAPAAALLPYAASHLLLIPALLAAAAWLLQHGPLDMALTRLFVDTQTHSFAWKHSAWLDIVGHQAARGLPILVGGVAIAAGVAGAVVPALQPWRAVLLTLGAGMLLGPLLINLLKTMTSQHCPSDLLEFGGVVGYAADRSAPFWAATRESAGHCLPGGHAGGGYALLGLYFAGWAAGRPAWRWQGLAIGIAAGALFSIVRIAQGAQFASATLWSASVDWTVCALLFMPLLCRPATDRQ